MAARMGPRRSANTVSKTVDGGAVPPGPAGSCRRLHRCFACSGTGSITRRVHKWGCAEGRVVGWQSARSRALLDTSTGLVTKASAVLCMHARWGALPHGSTVLASSRRRRRWYRRRGGSVTRGQLNVRLSVQGTAPPCKRPGSERYRREAPCGCRLMVRPRPSKSMMRVRFTSPAHVVRSTRTERSALRAPLRRCRRDRTFHLSPRPGGSRRRPPKPPDEVRLLTRSHDATKRLALLSLPPSPGQWTWR